MPSQKELIRGLGLQLQNAVNTGNRKKADRIMLSIRQTMGIRQSPTRAEMNAFWNFAKRRRHG